MNVYQTDHEGFYVNTTVADVDPMDETNHLIPAGCVTDAPPPLTEGQLAQWADGSWAVVTPVVEVEPEPEPVDATVEARAKRDGLLSSSDWTQVADAPVDQSAWASYRSLLRDVPQQVGFPTDITWPTKPE